MTERTIKSSEAIWAIAFILFAPMVLLYLVFSFCNWSFNPYDWYGLWRFVAALLWLVSSRLLFGFFVNNWEFEDETKS